MKKIFLLSVLFILLISCSSKENETYKDVISQLKINYNNNDYQAIFNQYSNHMQNYSNLEKTIAFYKDNVSVNAGNWNTEVFKDVKEGKHIYEVSFEKSKVAISIKLDKKNKINYLLLKKTKI